MTTSDDKPQLDSADDEYLKNNIVLSVIGANMAIVRIDQYTKEMEHRIVRLKIEPDTALAQAGEIRAMSVNLISDMEILKSSLDRYLNAFEDIQCLTPPPADRRRRNGDRLTRRRFTHYTQFRETGRALHAILRHATEGSNHD
jgi:hypothetical protein